MIVGGPQPGGEDVGSAAEWKCADYRTGFAATAYTDQQCSYATNEVAINWNAPLAYLAGALEAINAGYAPSFAAAGVARKNSSATSSSSSAVESSSSVGPQSSSSVNPVSSSSQWNQTQSSSSQWNPWGTSSSAITAIREIAPAAAPVDATPRLRVKDFKLFVEKNGKRYDLKGNKLR
jgi:endoglucanase